MPVYELWVKVPVDSRPTTTSKRPIRVQITANSPIDAISIARGQYGTENVVASAIKVRD